MVSRIVAEKLKDELKRPVVIDNRPGAGGRLAVELLKSAPADGSTVMVTPVVVPVLAPMVFSKLSYNPDADLAPVVRLCDFNFGLAVGPGAPVKNLKEYVAWLKANPQKANFGSPAADPALFDDRSDKSLDLLCVVHFSNANQQAILQFRI